ncbi:hypothetical protein ACJIZ3_017407 [Penstemon smallii]|uniref:Transcription repressor n=1 Tax=Penstemon smallii TaxID=265156 RepID=A0ABD3SVF6_9LAMI
MSSGKKWKFMKIFKSKGCGCGPKATDIIEPKPKSKTSFSDQKPNQRPSSSASSCGGDYTSTTFSINIDTSPHEYYQDCTKIRDSFAVVKDSDDPYQDFRQSMLQMIFEKEIYSRDGLQQLLQCFLQLNPRHHHETIIGAFMEIWNGGVAADDTTPCCSTRVT